MPSGRAIPLLIYGVWACVAQQNRAVNISCALPVATGFAAVTCNTGQLVEGFPCGIVPDPATGTFTSTFPPASHSHRVLVKCDLVELPCWEFPENLEGRSLTLPGSQGAASKERFVCACLSPLLLGTDFRSVREHPWLWQSCLSILWFESYASKIQD